MSDKGNDLILPVYLNQRVVFDLVAILRGGIAQVVKVTQIEHEGRQVTGDASARFGLSGALASLLRVDLSGSVRGEAGSSLESSMAEERVHTPTSLFAELRSIIREEGLLEFDREDWRPTPGCIVEFEAQLNKNPVIATMEALIEAVDLLSFARSASSTKQSVGGQKKTHDMKNTRKSMSDFLSMLRDRPTLDLITGPTNSGFRAVVTLERENLNDSSMADLIDGTFKVVGKVTRVSEAGGSPVSMVRNTPLQRVPLENLQSGFQKLPAVAQGDGTSFPRLEWEIAPPVFQLLPIAIFA